MHIRFEVSGRPRGKGRPRSFRRGKYIGHYTDAQTQHYEASVGLFCSQAMAGTPPASGPVILSIVARFAPPKSWSKKRRESAVYRDSKPDVDNIVKSVLDGCNGIAWRDDAQVVRLECRKEYRMDLPECVLIEAREVETKA